MLRSSKLFAFKTFKYPMHLESNKLTIRIANCLVTLTEDCNFAFKRDATLPVNVAKPAPQKQHNISAVVNQMYSNEREQNDEQKLP